ncbi:MAG TPA: acyltransferase [Polyangiales bacterium]|nr:acyltransferase [Polyangiales bacterium]
MKTHRILPVQRSAGLTECSALEIDLRFSYPGMLFFYAEQLDAERLRHALSRVLNDFSPFAGKLVVRSSSLQIEHGAAPALFETAQRDKSLAQLTAELRSHGRCRELEPQISILRLLLAREPMLLVRLTQLHDGSVLGIGWNHAVGDMHSTMLLMRAWADAYAGRAHKKPILVTERDAYMRSVLPNPLAVRPSARRARILPALAQRFELIRPSVRVHTEYSNSELLALQRALSSGGARSKMVSRNDALCAHVYTVLKRLSLTSRQTNLCLVVNFRKRIGLPDHIVGNMTSLVSQPVRKQYSASRIAAGLRRKLNEYANTQVNYHPTSRVFYACSRTSQRVRLVSRQFRAGSGDIFITNWDNFGAYDLAFDKARPELFRPIVLGSAQLPQWFMIVYELPRGQGLAVTVGLPKAVAKRWQSAEGQALLHTLPLEPVRCPEPQLERELSVV